MAILAYINYFSFYNSVRYLLLSPNDFNDDIETRRGNATCQDYATIHSFLSFDLVFVYLLSIYRATTMGQSLCYALGTQGFSLTQLRIPEFAV